LYCTIALFLAFKLSFGYTELDAVTVTKLDSSLQPHMKQHLDGCCLLPYIIHTSYTLCAHTLHSSFDKNHFPDNGGRYLWNFITEIFFLYLRVTQL